MGARDAIKLLAFLCLSGTGMAQPAHWSDDFDSYADGTELYHIGGWSGWDDVQMWSAIVSNTYSRSAPNSLHVEPPDTDAVQAIFAAECGQWVFTAYWYVPSGGLLGGDSWFIIQNEYNHGGPYQWALQTRADAISSMVIDDFRPSNPVPVVFDTWVEFRIDIDLDLNTCTQTYNGSVVSTGVWNAQGGPLAIANLDLFSTGGDSYYDDISLVATGNQDGEVLPNSIILSRSDAEPGDLVDVAVLIENASTSALSNVRTDLFIDPIVPLTGGAAEAREMSALFDNTLMLTPGPGTTAGTAFPGQTSMVEDIWRLYLTVNSDENVCGDSASNNVLGPILLGFSTPGVGAGICGDCNRDGTVSILDALRGSQLAAGILTATPQDYPVCDTDDSAVINVLDALRMAQEAAGLAPGLTCPPGGSAHLVELAEPATGASLPPGDVSVHVDLWDPAGAGVDLAFDFSTDGGVTYTTCASAGGSLVGGPASGGPDQVFVWDATLQVPTRPATGVQIRVTATANGIDKTATTTVDLN